MWTFYEFFCGGGMARLGLGPAWQCLFANDIDPKKGTAYRKNFGEAPQLTLCDVAKVHAKVLPGAADLVWASFPCQDLSLAGVGSGLSGNRSGAFWPFWSLMRTLVLEGRAPRIIALENVCGTLTSHGGTDFAAICQVLFEAGYKFGALVIDAVHFLPHSRPRLFIVGVSSSVRIPGFLISPGPADVAHPSSLLRALHCLSGAALERWRWWKLPPLPARRAAFGNLIEDKPADVEWESLERTRALLNMMSPLNLAKVQAAQLKRQRVVGAIYRRTRIENDRKIQRAEVRFDDVAGCLRTPAGGSSRQRILVVNGSNIWTRLISTREAARLMGLPDSYELPANYNDAYHLVGDGVAVPVVRYLSNHLFQPLLQSVAEKRAA